MPEETRNEPVAIIGIGCRFPGGVEDAESYWSLMANRVDAIVDIPRDRWDSRRFYDPNPDKPGKMYVRQGGFMTHPIWSMDAQFFGIAPREAAILDPQQRILLETSWEALEDAGVAPGDGPGSRTGVYIGAFCFDNAFQQAGIHSRDAIVPQTATSGSMVMLSNRISHALDLRGPSLTVDTACSASLVAVHLACQGLLNNDCDLAVAGGVNVMLRPEAGILECKGGFLSPDARCRTFDERANGYVRGEGAGIVVLKQYRAALADGDRIYAIIAATGINQDGKTPSVTVPNRHSQEELIAKVCAQANILPSQVSFVEAHGTATQAGDPVEVAALGNVLAHGREPGKKVWIGSVKTNIGHLEAAAGVAGLIKVALCLKNRQFPPNLHFNRPNPKLNLDSLCLEVPTTLVNLAHDGPLWAAINSFGYGGTNAHAILQSAESQEIACGAESPEGPILLPLSARSVAALADHTGRIAKRAHSLGPNDLEDLCFTASRRRSHHVHRVAVVADSIADLIQKLSEFARGESPSGVVTGRATIGAARKLVFVYSGMGAPWRGMGASLSVTQPVFRAALEDCNQAFIAHGGPEILKHFDALALDGSFGQSMREPGEAQPANLALQVALSTLWRSWGIEPEAIIGHSVGEVAAAWASGVLSLDEAVRLTLHRSRLQQKLAGKGTMLAVEISRDAVVSLLDGLEGRVSVGAINGPASVVLTGYTDALAKVTLQLRERNIFHRFLEVACAYHSNQMDSIEEEFRSSVRAISNRPARTPLFSSVTGCQIRPGEQDLDYWWRNVREPVFFCDALKALEAEGQCAYLEVGPHPTLSAGIAATLMRPERAVVTISSLNRKKDERTAILEALGSLYANGCNIDWTHVHPRGRLLTLPKYPWQRDTLWSETRASRADRLVEEIHPLLHQRLAAPVPTWETELNEQFAPFLKDHRLWNVPVFPAAGYAAACIAVAEASSGSRTVETLQFHKPLVLEKGAILRLQLDERDGYLSINARTQEVEQSEWLSHATARISAGPRDSTLRKLNLEVLRARCPRTVAPHKIYDALAAIGLEYGACFQVIEMVWQGDQEVVGKLKCHDSLKPDCGRYDFHPTLLDGAFQLLVATTDITGIGKPVIPTHIDRISYYGRTDSACWAYVRNTKHTENALEGDLTLCNARGEVLVEVQGLRCQLVSHDASTRYAKTAKCLYDCEWIESEAPGNSLTGPNVWLAFEDGCGIGGMLGNATNSLGAAWITVRPGRHFEIVDGIYYINPRSTSDMQELLASVGRRACISGICYLWALDAGSEDRRAAIEIPSIDDLATVLSLAQAVIANPAIELRRFYLITRSLQAIDKKTDTPNPGQAAVWGIGRVLANERPELHCVRVDIDQQPPPATILALSSELFSDSPEDELAFRAGRRFVPRVTCIEGLDTVTEVDAATETFGLDIDTPGILETLRYRRTPRRPPGPGEVEMKVEAASVNFKDLMKAMKLLPTSYMEETFTGSSLGIECSGTIVAIGDNVENLKVGDDIVVIGNNGCFRSYNTVPTSFLAHKPLSFDQSPCLISFLTPYYAFRYVAQLQEGESVLIHCATGGVGLAAIQVARWLGARIYATAGNEEKRAYLRGLGIEHVMDSRSLEFAAEVMAKTNNRGIDVILNCLSGEALRQSIGILASYGRFLEIGKRDIAGSANLGLAQFDRNLSFSAIDTDRMGAERPVLFRKLIDEICEFLRTGIFQPLPVTTFPVTQTVDAFRHMARAKHIGKVVVQVRNGKVPLHSRFGEASKLAPDAAYLITGGMGGVGSIVAKWMVLRGARHLVIASRSGAATVEQQEMVRHLEQQGARVYVRKVDCSNTAAVSEVFDMICRDLPPLRGIVHAAMVLDDAPVNELNRSRLEDVWRSKALAAWNLHRESLNTKLDFFLLCSSAAALIGNAGQVAYVAANGYLDALAAYRHARGLPALSVAWGAIEAGVVSRNPLLLDRFRRLGIRAFTPVECVAFMDHLLQMNGAYVAAVDMDWPTWKAAQPWVANRPRFSRIVGQSGADPAVISPRLTKLLESAPEQRQKLMETFLCDDLSRVIHLPAAKIDVQLTFENMGLDSLMMVELTTTLNLFWGVGLSPASDMQGSSIAAVASELIATILRKHSPDETVIQEEYDVDALSEEQLDALLATLSGPSADIAGQAGGA